MIKKQKLISLAGCLAAGKTTLSQQIIKQFPQLVLAQEDIGNHEVFLSWIRREHSDGMLTQLEFYIRSVDLLMSMARSRPTATVLSDFSIDIHHWVYSRTLHDSKLISDQEWEICCEVYSHIETLLKSRFEIYHIALRVPKDTLLQRLQNRMRDSGDTITIGTVTAYVLAFESWLASHPEVSILLEEDISGFIRKIIHNVRE